MAIHYNAQMSDDEKQSAADDEQNLFTDAMRDVAPLKKSNQVEVVAAADLAEHTKPFTQTMIALTEFEKLLIEQAQAGGMPDDEQASVPTQLIPLCDFSMAALDSPLTANQPLYFRRSGVRDKQMRQLRQGKIAIEDKLDLHGVTIEQATNMLERFLQTSLVNGARCLLVVHGKGTCAASSRPILKNYCDFILPQVEQVLAYCSAARKHGGTGAIYVLIKNYQRTQDK